MHLIVMGKEPIPGQVKTRLCPPCTPGDAAAIAEAALADTLDACSRSGADEVVLALSGRPGPWCPEGVRVIDQGDGTFNDRLSRAWTSVEGPAFQIGMDTPQLTSADLDASMAALADVAGHGVLGPAEDGGWWSLGLRAWRPGVFDGVPMSRPDTCARQLDRLTELGLSVSLLPTHRDVDEIADAVAVAEAHPTLRFSAAVRRVPLLLASGCPP